MLGNRKRFPFFSLSYASVALAYVCVWMRRNCAPSTYVRESRVGWVDSQFEHDLSPSSVYTHIKYIHKNVIITSYIRHRCILMGLYVSIKNIMNPQEKKLDISACLYVLIIIAAFAVGITL